MVPSTTDSPTWGSSMVIAMVHHLMPDATQED
jgi:hypothetical protein